MRDGMVENWARLHSEVGDEAVLTRMRFASVTIGGIRGLKSRIPSQAFLWAFRWSVFESWSVTENSWIAYISHA